MLRRSDLRNVFDGYALPGIGFYVVDVLFVISAETDWGEWLYIGATVVIGAAYGLYLAKRVETPTIHRADARKESASDPQKV